MKERTVYLNDKTKIKVMEHNSSKWLIATIGGLCGFTKWILLQITGLGITEMQKLLWAVVVAGFCGAASAGGGIVLKWMIKYSKEFLKNKKFIK